MDNTIFYIYQIDTNDERLYIYIYISQCTYAKTMPVLRHVRSIDWCIDTITIPLKNMIDGSKTYYTLSNTRDYHHHHLRYRWFISNDAFLFVVLGHEACTACTDPNENGAPRRLSGETSSLLIVLVSSVADCHHVKSLGLDTRAVDSCWYPWPLNVKVKNMACQKTRVVCRARGSRQEPSLHTDHIIRISYRKYTLLKTYRIWSWWSTRSIYIYTRDCDVKRKFYASIFCIILNTVV